MTNEHNNGSQKCSSINNNNSSSSTNNTTVTTTTTTTTITTAASNSSNSNANNNNSNSSSSSSNSDAIGNNHSCTSEHIIAEATKILLKNGLNGTAATAAILSAAAAATFQLPAPPPRYSATTVVTSAVTATSESTSSASLANGLLQTSATLEEDPHVMATATATTTNLLASKASDLTVIGGASAAYSNSKCGTTNSLYKYTGKSSSSNNSSGYDMGRHPISAGSNNSSYGGRLQFYKDGKFILELARAKDGEKGGWISVPRKPFRTPSAATSATVTPSSAATTTYPKNENSTSLSFSDDNSSIQSSPWQRDHSWKQSRPRRGISKGMSLYYQRPKNVVLTNNGLSVALHKRRRPYEPIKNVSEMFECQEPARTKNSIKLEEVGTLKVKRMSDILIKSELVKCEKEIEKSKDEIDSFVQDTPEQTVCVDSKADIPITSTTVVKSDAELSASVDCAHEGKMNTSDDEDRMSTAIAELMAQKSDVTLNGNTDDVVNGIKTEVSIDTKQPETQSLNSNGITDVAEKRLKREKKRAKLSTIIQKLIDSVPSRLENFNKIPVSPATGVGFSGGGAINCLNHNLAHKVSPPTSAATRLVEYHQQHVSPRKRILREFEKVSLEDNTVNNGAGGKRSRAKGSSAITSTKSSPSRSVAPPQSTTPQGSTSSSNYSATAAKIPVTTSATPTRLNSSYSIHSLLGGSSTSSSSEKKSNSQSTAIVSNVHQQHAIYSSAAYPSPRAVHASPRSPESGGGGKSPSQSTIRKRSPPYAAVSSPLHEAHSRSPSMALDYGRRTPPDSYKLSMAHQAHQSHHHLHPTYYPPPYAMSPQYVPSPGSAILPTNAAHSNRLAAHTASTSSATSSSSASSSTQSPHIPNAAAMNALAARDLSPPRSTPASPREHATTPRTVPKKTASIRREFASPTASKSSNATSCSSPPIGEQMRRSVTPERKVASTSSASASQHAAAAATHQHMQRGSPSAAAMAAAGSPLHYYMYGGGSTQAASNGPSSQSQATSAHIVSTPSNSAAAMAAAAAAAAYIPSMVYPPYISTLAGLRSNPLWFHHYQAGGAAAMPPHPAATTSAAAAARLAQPFNVFAYNGLGAAAVAAAAAAAAFGQAPAGQPPPSVTAAATHLQHYHQQHLQQHAVSIMTGTERRAQTPKSTDSIIDSNTTATNPHHPQQSSHQPTPPQHHQQQQQQHHTHEAQNQQQQQQQQVHSSALADSTANFLAHYANVATTSAGSGATHQQQFHIKNEYNSEFHIKDEFSSDVPLNLSKH